MDALDHALEASARTVWFRWLFVGAGRRMVGYSRSPTVSPCKTPDGWLVTVIREDPHAHAA